MSHIFNLLFYCAFTSFGFVEGKSQERKEWRRLNEKDRVIVIGWFHVVFPAANTGIPYFGEIYPVCTPTSTSVASSACYYKKMSKFQYSCCGDPRIFEECTWEHHFPLNPPCTCGGPQCNMFDPKNIDQSKLASTTTPTTTTSTTTTTTTTQKSTPKPTTKSTTQKPTTKKTTQKPTIKKTTHKATTKKAGNTTPAPAQNNKLTCYSCEATQGNSDGACRDHPTSTKAVVCPPGHVCRTVSYVSTARGGSVLIRGCADPKDDAVLSRKRNANGCVRNPPYLPVSCDGGNCDHPSCACTCTTNFCNNVIYPGGGWSAC